MHTCSILYRMTKTPFVDLLMPWEHSVCSECFQNNPYAIWLIKQQCFQPRRHQNAFQIIIAIDQNYMDMVNIRPLPPNYAQFRGGFVECWNYQCPDGTACHFAHSKIEADTWSIKKRMIKGTMIHEIISHWTNMLVHDSLIPLVQVSAWKGVAGVQHSPLIAQAFPNSP